MGIADTEGRKEAFCNEIGNSGGLSKKARVRFFLVIFDWKSISESKLGGLSKRLGFSHPPWSVVA